LCRTRQMWTKTTYSSPPQSAHSVYCKNSTSSPKPQVMKQEKRCRLQQSRSATPNIQTPSSASHQPYIPIYPPLTLRNTKRHLAYHNAPSNDVGYQLIRNPKLKTARALNARGFMLFYLVANHAMRLRQECNASVFIAVCRFICAPCW
jgi:hypothetical protein